MLNYRSSAVPLTLLFLLSCAGPRPERVVPHAGPLPPCPASPNCVSSDEGRRSHRVAPIQLTVPASEAWPVIIETVAARPRTRIVSRTSTYLHAECTSSVFRYVDDLELRLLPGHGAVAVRSASRMGYGDLGVNARRVETLRSALVERGVARDQSEGGRTSE